MNRPLVSVVVPVYNVSKYIAACIQSLLAQSYHPLEIILVDDGSKDDSIAIAGSVLAETNANYQIIRQKNSGVSAARNHGIRQATGELVIALDADDRLRPDALEKMVAAYDRNCVQCVVCNYVLLRDGQAPRTNTPVDTSVSIRTGSQACHKYFHREEIYVSPAMLLSKAFLTENGIVYDEACRFAEDDLYVWHVLSKAENIAFCKEPLYEYIFHANSTMTSATYERFFSSYHGAVRLEETVIRHEPNTRDLTNSFVMRHMLGVIHAAAKVLVFPQFEKLINEVDFGRLCKGKSAGTGLKTRLLLACFHINRKLFYEVCRKF